MSGFCDKGASLIAVDMFGCPDAVPGQCRSLGLQDAMETDAYHLVDSNSTVSDVLLLNAQLFTPCVS